MCPGVLACCSPLRLENLGCWKLLSVLCYFLKDRKQEGRASSLLCLLYSLSPVSSKYAAYVLGYGWTLPSYFREGTVKTLQGFGKMLVSQACLELCIYLRQWSHRHMPDVTSFPNCKLMWLDFSSLCKSLDYDWFKKKKKVRFKVTADRRLMFYCHRNSLQDLSFPVKSLY